METVTIIWMYVVALHSIMRIVEFTFIVLMIVFFCIYYLWVIPHSLSVFFVFVLQKDTNIRVSRYGAHLFHTSYDEVWDYVQRFGPWHTYRHKVRGMVNGKDVPIPPNIETVNTLFDLNLKTQQDMDTWLQKEQQPNPNPTNSEQVALARVGQRLYDLIFKPYTFKQWNKYPAELGPEVLQRIPVRNNWNEEYFNDPHQALPTNGYTSLFENMYKSQYITVLTNTDYFEIRDQVSCGAHYFSGPIDAYFANHKLPKLEYRSLDFERKVEYNKHLFQPAFVVNRPQAEDGDFTRIVEYKHLYNQSDLPHTVYFIERSTDVGEPYYPVPNQRNKDLFAQYQQLAREEEQNKNVTFVGRLANYKYFNMDQAIQNALELFTKNTGIPYTMRTAINPTMERVENLKFAPAVPADAASKPVEKSVAATTTNAVGTNNRMLPDWRQAVDCSAWDNMCGSLKQIEDKYLPYPFPYGVKVKQDKDLVYTNLTEIPKDWALSLEANTESSGDKFYLDAKPARPIQYIYPTRVSEAEREECLKQANELPWQDQVDFLLKNRLTKESTTNMVAFTISDYNYAYDMMHDVFGMNDKVVGFKGSFFMVAIDQQTLELGCTYGYPMVAWPSAKPDVTEALAEAVANTKFEVSLDLLKKGYDFFFYEMDVWFLRTPVQIMKHFHSQPEGDVLVSSHQNCPMCANIGVYSIASNERTVELFEILVALAKESPKTHDQFIVTSVLGLAQELREGRRTNTFDTRWNPQPKVNPPVMHHPPHRGFYNAFEIVASERPIPTQQAYAIHTLNGAPLQKPHGKKILAKELGAWYGFEGPNGEGGYYRRKGANRRYLWMDGHMPNSYSSVANFEYNGWESALFHSEQVFKYTMATLLALARRTGRIFVMPRFVADHGVHYLWTLLDFSTVEDMQIDYRETNFPHNPKSWNTEDTPFGNVARTAMGAMTEVGKERSMMVQMPTSGEDGGPIQAWKFDESMNERQALDAWWALHTAIPEVDSAELLLANPHFINRLWTGRMESQRKGKQNSSMSVAEREIAEVYSRLKWCFDKGTPIVTFENIVGRSAPGYDCHGKGVFETPKEDK